MAERIGSSSGEAKRPATVLIIEDDAETQGSLSQVLSDEGYAVVAASDGKAGLRAVNAVNPDAIVLDLMMPIMNGWDFLDALRRDPKHGRIPVVVVSAFYDARRDLGRVCYLPKPPRLEALLAAVAEACGRGPQSELG